MELHEFDLPAYWATYIFNADESGLTDWDREHMFPELESIASQGLEIVELSDEPYFGRYAGLGCDMLTYTAIALR